MNAVERGVVLARTDYLDVTDFSFMQNSMLQTDRDSADSAALSVKGDVPLEEIEKAAILSTLQAAGGNKSEGNKSEAARRLGITRKTLHKKLKAYGEMP
jgi:two-component system response regulator HydG